MRVVIDARMIGPIPHGIARYVTRLASGLSSLRAQLPYEPVFLVDRDFPDETFFGFKTLRTSSRFLSMREWIEIPFLLKKTGASLYHSPSFSSLLRSPCPWIVTIHDLNHLRYGGFFRRFYYRAILRPFALGASRVVTVSEFSRSEISGWLHRHPNTVEIAYNALEPALTQPPSPEESLKVLSRFHLKPGQYFFCLSNPKPHKNIPFLIQSYGELRKSRSDAWPLLVSVQGFASEDGVVQTGGLQDEEVRVLRAQAGAVVFPSLYEGFGLSPVEAALSGTPLIVSKIPPHQEGLSDLQPDQVLWIDPTDRRSLTEALEKAQNGGIAKTSEDTRQKILTRFGERDLAGRMDRIYRNVLGIGE